MDRKKKYTHITARVYSTAKDISSFQLKKYCNYTLSEAYWRMEEGKGLMSLYDQESFSLWSNLMNEVSRIKSTIPLSGAQYERLSETRCEVWNSMEDYRIWLEKGSSPIYISEIASSNGLDDLFVYRAIEDLYDMVNESLHDDNMMEIIIDRALTLEEAFERHCQRQIERGEKPDKLRVPQNSVYQIRADFSHKKSDSENIRYLLNGIWEIQNKSSEEHRKIYKHNSNIIRQYKDLKGKPSPHIDPAYFFDILHAIAIPKYQELTE